jgi:small-conductance mechanosensitive channel
VGVITAGAVAFSYLGLSLDRIAIVAGALSVGIGFGLQSIVNNFVSGLILLWERPIRVGDLVVVGDGEGYVRRINVRATEIETFDRATVVVPNSNLISGVVRNAEIMRNCALAHREVMSEPGPRVLFKKMTDTAIEFDLVCFVDEIETAGPVSSDLYFAIFRRLREEGIGTPAAVPATVRVQDLDKVQEQLSHIADTVELNRAAAATSGVPMASAGIPGDLPLQALKAPARIIRKPKAKPAQ